MKLRISVPHPYVVVSLILVAVFVAPVMGSFNGVFEAACVIVVFPFVLMAGAGVTDVDGLAGRVCRFAGELSYPVYVIHYPFIYIFAHWNWMTHPGKPLLATVAVAMYCGVIGFAFALSRWYDRPLRAWLSRTCLQRDASPAMPNTHVPRIESRGTNH